MTDTTTTVPAATEGEMAHIKQIFERAANAIVQASELSKQVGELQAQFTSLKNDLEHFRQRNAELDTMLSDVRTQRDKAIEERDSATRNARDLDETCYNQQNTISNLKAEVEDIRNKLNRALTDSDSWMQAAEKSDNDLQAANSKLAKLREALGIVEPKAEPTPVPQPVAQTLPVGSAHVDPTPTYNDPFPTEPSKPSSDDTLHTDTPTPWKSW